jgi:isocitrate dehydrogenase kinase/phosphatase
MYLLIHRAAGYIERRSRPLNLLLRETDPAAAKSSIIDYGNALRDLAARMCFPATCR